MTAPAALTADDRGDIERLVYAYCDAVDRAAIDALLALFTADAVIDYGHGRLIVGRDRIGELFRDRLDRYGATSHHASNVTIDPTPDGAEVASSVYAWHLLEDGSHAEVWGRYDDIVVRRSGGWQLSSRRIRAAGWRGFPDPPGLPGPFERIDRGGRS